MQLHCIRGQEFAEHVQWSGADALNYSLKASNWLLNRQLMELMDFEIMVYARPAAF